MGARFAWLFTSPYLIRLLDRRPRQRALRLGARPPAVMAAAGFRGAVSLALALAVPAVLGSGEPFPDRDLIVFWLYTPPGRGGWAVWTPVFLIGALPSWVRGAARGPGVRG